MAADKLNQSLDAIIKASSSKAQRRGGRSSATATQTDSTPGSRGGVHKAAGRRQSSRQAAGRQTNGRTLRPRRRSQGAAEDDEVVVEGLRNGDFIKVSGTSQTKAVAGKIAHEARLGQPPALLAKGSSSLNQAIKAVAVARQYLQGDKADITCQPAFRGGKRMACLALYLAKRRPVAFPTKDVREEVPGALTSIGEHAATIAMRAICSGRLYLEEDKCDIKALIEFESVVKGEKGDILNALRFNILVEDV